MELDHLNNFHFAKLDGVKTYMRMRRVPAHLQTKVIRWFDYLWLTQKCSDEEKAISCLPDILKTDVSKLTFNLSAAVFLTELICVTVLISNENLVHELDLDI
ncbi:hypothetical protein PGB90_003364 [Kerria lacca]